MVHPIVIIGTGLAGYQLAREFRKQDQQSPLILITQDDGRYYPKPQLSNALTSGKTADTLVTSTSEQMAAQLNATILTACTVLAIDPQKKQVRLENDTLTYEKLVLACGADVIKAPIEGNAVNDILSINHLYHYAHFQALIKNKKTIAILGAGLIGSEFANDLSNAHYKVHVIAPAKAPLDLLVPEEIGLLLQHALEKNGVTFHLQATAKRFDQSAKGYQLTLSDGTQLDVDFLLSAIGLTPHIDLAKHAGIATQRGIMVNRYLETSEPHIYALGDCAEVEGHVLPYIAPILNCSRALAKTLAGEKTCVEYPAMPIIVKTPAHPIAVCPPPKGILGQWQIEQQDNHTRALFYNDDKQLLGFVLTNDAVKERMALAKQLPSYF